MAFNLHEGHVIAAVRGGVLDGQLLRLTPEKHHTGRTFDNLVLPDSEFVPYPDTERERDTYYIVGSSGSGKSYFTAQYCSNYKKAYPDRIIYLFSKGREDKAFDSDPDLVTRVKCQKFTDELKAAEFYQEYGPKSLVIYDDVDTIARKDISRSLKQLKDDILEMGRKPKIAFLGLAHLASRGNETRRDLSESQVIVIFPMSLSGSNERMLQSYVGLSRKEILVIKKQIKSRWVAIHRHVYPPVWVSQRECGLLSDLADYVPPLLRRVETMADIDKESTDRQKCLCGGFMSGVGNKARHMKTKRHRRYLAQVRESHYQNLALDDVNAHLDEDGVLGDRE